MTSSQINEIFDKTSFLHGINAAYIEEMFEKFQSNPNSVPSDWKEFFTGITDNIKKQPIHWKYDLNVVNKFLDKILTMERDSSGLVPLEYGSTALNKRR